VFPAFPADKNPCSKETLLEYVSRTESYRGSGSYRKTKLYIKGCTTPFHHHLLLHGSWPLADIDTSKFKAHSTAAVSAGITTNQIMEAAESVFQQFCYKYTNSNAVGVSVLSTAPTSSLQTSH